MNKDSRTTLRLLILIGAYLFVSSATLQAAGIPSDAATEKNANFQIFYLSRGYSKGFTEDPRSIGADYLLHIGFPKPQLVYVSQAWGNAIYSYPHAGIEEVSDDPEIVYVDKGYGQAIYSYPGNVGKGLIIGVPKEVN